MNKKFFFIIAALLMSLTVSAQLSVKGGLGISNMIGKYAEDNNLGAKLGFIVGLGYDYEFAQGVALQTGLYALSKGYKAADLDVTANAIYMQVPIHVAAKIDFTPGTRIVIHGGPFVAYGIAGKINASGSTYNTFGENSWKRLDAGFGLGAGAEMGMFLFDLGVDMGLLNPNENHKASNLSAYLAIGLRF